MKPLRLGFIGGGIDSAVGRAHYAACRMDGKLEVVAGCFSRSKAASEKTGEAFNACALENPTNLLNARGVHGIDAVVVLTPTPSHYKFAHAALLSGVPVICEKALCTTQQDTATLIKLRDKHSGFLAVTYNYTGYPMVRELRYMVLSKELGEIISIQAEMPQEGYLREGANPQDWRKEDGSIPSVHLDLGAHLHHLIHYITDDKPASLVAHQQSRGAFGVVDDVQCIAEYHSGFVASIWFGKTAIGHRNGLRIRVNGTLGSAEWLQSNPEELACAYANGFRGVMDRSVPACVVASEPRYQRFKAGHPAGFIEAYANLYDDLHAWLLKHKSGACDAGLTKQAYSAEIAHDGLVMMEAMVKSAKEKIWVTL